MRCVREKPDRTSAQTQRLGASRERGAWRNWVQPPSRDGAGERGHG
ncbi:hypothetical protein ACFPRL_05235 [Pseudoclavibacter helvolus]